MKGFYFDLGYMPKRSLLFDRKVNSRYDFFMAVAASKMRIRCVQSTKQSKGNEPCVSTFTERAFEKPYCK